MDRSRIASKPTPQKQPSWHISTIIQQPPPNNQQPHLHLPPPNGTFEVLSRSRSRRCSKILTSTKAFKNTIVAGPTTFRRNWTQQAQFRHASVFECSRLMMKALLVANLGSQKVRRVIKVLVYTFKKKCGSQLEFFQNENRGGKFHQKRILTTANFWDDPKLDPKISNHHVVLTPLNLYCITVLPLPETKSKNPWKLVVGRRSCLGNNTFSAANC